MPSVICTLKLVGDDDPYQVRRTTLDVTGGRLAGVWSVMTPSSDPRLAFEVQSGSWSANEDGNNTFTAYLFDASWRIHLELYTLPGDFLSSLTCGSAYAGSGRRFDQPPSDVTYQMSFGCI